MDFDVIKKQLENHLALVSADEVRVVCRPLEEHLGIRSVVYKSVCDDGSEIVLSTHPEWIHYFFEHGLYKQSVLEKEPSNYVHGELLWSNIPTHTDILTATRECFDIDHGVTLIRPYTNGCDFFYFGADRQNIQAQQLMSNNIDLLDKFTHYFKYKLADVISKGKARPLRIPNKFTDNELDVSEIVCYQSHAMRARFLNDIYKDGIYLTVDGHMIHLTKREYLVAKEFLKGKTMQQLADDLFISPRTVESHLDNIKVKFNIRRKSDLLILLSELI